MLRLQVFPTLILKRAILLCGFLLTASLAVAGEDTIEVYRSFSPQSSSKTVFRASEAFLSARPSEFNLTKADLEHVIKEFAVKSDSRVSRVILGIHERRAPFNGIPFEAISFVTTDANRVVLDANGRVLVFGDKTILSPKIVQMSAEEIEAAQKRQNHPAR